MANQTTPAIQIKDSNVGIGTASPTYKLEVTNKARLYNVSIGGTDGGTYDGYSDSVVGIANLHLAAQGAGAVYINTSIARPMYINPVGGNVGIGTTSPVVKLQVDGTITSTGVLTAYTSVPSINIGHNGDSAFIAATSGGGADTPISFSVGNNNEKMRITTAGNVGIGTTAPATALDVNGTISVGGSPIASFSGNYNRILRPNGTVGIYLGNATDAGNYYDNTTHYFRSSAGSSVYAVIDYLGNVGIGTTNPTEKLSLAGSTSTTLGLSLEPSGWNNAKHRLTVPVSGDTSVWSFNYNGSAVDSSSYATSSISITQGVVLFSTGAANTAPSERMRIAPSGNVLIGTTTDAGYKLDVNGNVRIGANTGSARLNVGGAANEWVADFQASTTSNQSYGLIIRAGTNSNDYPFYVVNAATNVFFFSIRGDGNVGIGTTTPSHKLQVVGPGTFASSTTSIDGNVGLYMTIGGSANNYNGILFQGVSVSDMYFGRAAGAGVDDLIIFGGGERVRFKQNGNVGIGTTIPGSRLQVTATSTSATTVDNGITILNDSGVNNCLAGIRLSTYGDSDGGLYPKQFIGAIRDGAFGAGKGSIVFCNRDAADTSVVALSDEKMRILPSGNVGIGTTAPTEILNISRVSTNNYIKVEAGGQAANYSGLMLTEYGINWGWALRHNAATDLLHISYQDNTPTFSDTVTFNRNGNVGIGTTAPGYKLDVFGASSADAFVRVIGGAGATKGGYVFGNNDGTKDYGKIYFDNSNNNIYFFQYYNAGDIIFGANSTERMRMTNAGNFGIGTTAPAAKLEVYAGSNSTANTILWGQTIRNAGNGATTGYGAGLKLKNSADSVPNELYKWAGVAAVAGSNYSDRTDLAFYTNAGVIAEATEKVRITGDGNLGIGTIAPGAPLSVAGVGGSTKGTNGYIVNIGGTDGNVDPVRYMIGFTHGNTYTAGNVRAAVGMMVTTGGAGNLVFETGTSGAGQLERMRINGSGNVGIGTTAPTNIIHVVGVPRFDSPSDPPTLYNASVDVDRYYGTNQGVLTSPEMWLKIDIDGTSYLIPAFEI